MLLTFTPLTNTESLQMIHEFFLKPRAVRGKCIFSGDWHVTPHMSDDIQREFSKSIRTCTSDKSFRLDQKCVWMFQKDQTDMKAAIHYLTMQIKIQSASYYPPCALSKLLRSDWTNGWRTRASFLSGQRFFSLLLCPDPLWGPNSLSDTEQGLFVRVKWWERALSSISYEV